jgi:hypothetical protein
MKNFDKPCKTINDKDALIIMAYDHWANKVVKRKKFWSISVDLRPEVMTLVKSAAKELAVDVDSVIVSIVKMQLEKLREKKK